MLMFPNDPAAQRFPFIDPGRRPFASQDILPFILDEIALEVAAKIPRLVGVIGQEAPAVRAVQSDPRAPLREIIQAIGQIQIAGRYNAE